MSIETGLRCPLADHRSPFEHLDKHAAFSWVSNFGAFPVEPFLLSANSEPHWSGVLGGRLVQATPPVLFLGMRSLIAQRTDRLG